MTETQLTSAIAGASSTKAAVTTFLVAHSVGLAVVGGLLFGVGAYYGSKSMANRARRKSEEATDAIASAAT